MRPDPHARALGRRFRMALDRRPSGGPAGQHLGRGVGSSLEFQDRRAYVAGDDVRHLDWAAYARTDQPMVRLYREEVAPRVELLLDASASMGVEAGKAELALDLVALLAEAARAAGCVPTLVRVGERAEPLELERFHEAGVALDGRRPIHDALSTVQGFLRPGATRVLVSDFLTPAAPSTWVRPLAARGGGLWLVQVLGPGDADPPRDDALRLTDAEGGGALDLVLDERTRRAYLERLERLGAAVAEEARRAGGRSLRLVGRRTSGVGGADEGDTDTAGAGDGARAAHLEALCRADLLSEGLLEPA